MTEKKSDTEKFLSSENFEYKVNEPLSGHTSLGIGGKACFFVEVKTEEELRSLLKFANENKIPFYILGGGTNTLFSDDGFKGIIIKLSVKPGSIFAHMSLNVSYVSAVDVCFECGAALSLPYSVNQTARQGLSGLEHLAGIPGTVGGAVFGNAGVKIFSISDCLKKIEVINFDGVKQILDRKDINFTYRNSGLKNCIITRAFFMLKKANKNDILDVILRELTKRKNTQPSGTKNAGCVFKNPQNDFAARLIDSLNLKKYRVGDAEVSAVHANFFINKNNCSAKNMLALMDFVKNKVYEKYNIILEPEIRIVK